MYGKYNVIYTDNKVIGIVDNRKIKSNINFAVVRAKISRYCKLWSGHTAQGMDEMFNYIPSKMSKPLTECMKKFQEDLKKMESNYG